MTGSSEQESPFFICLTPEVINGNWILYHILTLDRIERNLQFKVLYDGVRKAILSNEVYHGQMLKISLRQESEEAVKINFTT